jgi:hypothetical protein
MHLHHSRPFQEHVRMLLQSLRALCKPPGGAGSIWKYLEAVVRATGVSGRYAYGFRTELHFADAGQFRNISAMQWQDKMMILSMRSMSQPTKREPKSVVSQLESFYVYGVNLKL